jgi:hypothetical protein
LPKSIVIECPASDCSFFEDLAAKGHDVTIAEVERFDGTTNQIIEVLVEVTTALSPILIAYFSRPSKEQATKKVVVDGQRKTLENYSPEEIKAVLGSE